MTPKGLFALNTHIRRREAFQKPSAEHFGHERPVSDAQRQVEFTKNPERYAFWGDIPVDWVATDKKRDKFTLEDEDFDPWWNENDVEPAD